MKLRAEYKWPPFVRMLKHDRFYRLVLGSGDVCSYAGCASSSYFVLQAYGRLRYASTCMQWLFDGLVHCCSLAELAASMESVLEGGGSTADTGHDARHLTCDELGITGIVSMYSYRFLPSPKCSNRLWDPISLLFNWYRRFFF